MYALISALLAQASDQPLNWGSVLQGALGSSPVAVVLAWQLWQSQKRNAEKDAELRETNEKLLALAERALPPLTEATRTMVELRAAMGPADGTVELQAELRRLRRHLDDLSSRGEG